MRVVVSMNFNRSERWLISKTVYFFGVSISYIL